MWADNETEQDLIGFKIHADLVAEVVSDVSLLPVTLGVFGDWGSGKTSIMKMLQAQLSTRDDVAVLYFDAWLFEGYDDAKSALISSILKQLTQHKRFPIALRDEAAQLVKRVNWMRVMKMGWDHVALPAILAYATGGATAVPSLMNAVRGCFGSASHEDGEKRHTESPDAKEVTSLLGEAHEPDAPDVRTFREDFCKLLRKTNFKALVVLIDDLDRCSPDRIVENLEAIKLFLNVGSTAFVIGADPRIVHHAISVRYKDAIEAARQFAAPGERTGEAGDQLARDYVEKLIQIPYHLPRLSPAEIETYMALLFAQRDLDAEGFAVCVASCDARRLDNRFSAFGLADVRDALGETPVPDTLATALTFVAGAAPIITENLKGNPRQVKRFLNAFVLRRKLADIAKMAHVRDDVLLKLMLLEYSNEPRFRELARWHEEQKKTPVEIVRMEAGEEFPKEWDKEPLRRWVQMEPHLREVDLSDYVWLVRDKLATSMVGLTLIPPVVRNAYKALLSETGRKQAAAMLKNLRQEEFETLLSLLVKHLQREPQDSEGYNAFLKVLDFSPAIFPELDAAVRLLPPRDLPAWLPGSLELAVRIHASLRSPVDSLLAYLRAQGDAPVARAALPRKGS